MNGFRIWALQDLSHILPAKSLQHETYVPSNVFKRCLSNFLNFSRKQKNTHESKRINLSTVSNNLEPIFTTWMASPEITTTIFNSRLPTYFLPFKTNTEIMHLDTLKPFIKYDELLHGNPASRSNCYKILPNIQAGDFGFVLYNDNTVIKSDKVYYDDCTSKIISTLQENQQPRIDRTIKQVSTDNLSTCTTAKNVDFPSLAKPESKTPEIQQQHTRDLFETLQQLNATMKPQGYTKNTAKRSTFSKIENSRNIPLEWSSMEWSYPRREYHTWKPSEIENDAIRCDDHCFFASDIRTMRQEQNAGYKSSRFHHLTHSGSSGNQGSQNSSLCLPSVPRRVFSSRSCTVTQQSIREIKNLRKDLNANTSIVRLRSTRSHPDRVFLQSFSCDASRSKRSADCEDDKSQRSKHEDDTEDVCSQEVTKSRCRIESKKICGKTRQKDTNCVSSQNDAREKRQQRKSKPCKSYMCPELKQQRPCSWDAERCPEDRRKRDAKERVSSRDRSRQSRDSNCSQEQGRQSKSYERDEDCEKTDEPRAICKGSIKLRKKKDCESKCEKRHKKRDISKKERRKCTGNSRKRSNSCRRRNSSRAGDKSCSKVDGKRRYSQQSIFSVSQDRKCFSTLIPNIVLGTNVNKTTQRFYASCSNKDEKDQKHGPFCEKRKRKCEAKEKDKIKKKCVKGPAKCMSRKKTTGKMQTCQSTQKDKHKKTYKSTKKSNHEEFCTSRKKEFIKDEKLKTKPVKACTSSTMKDKKPKEQSLKKQIGREYKEIDECKKGFKKEKRGNKAKMVSIEHKPTGLGSIISSYKEQKKDSEKFASTPNESIISTDTIFKWFNIQSRIIINGKIPIVAKDVKLFNVMFDRSFSTATLDYQDDFAIERTMNNGKMAKNYSANSDDFIHGDELPNYVEIEYEDEEDDVYDIGPLVDRSPESIESYMQKPQ